MPAGYLIAHMSGADVFGLVVSVLVIAYLFYALIRGEKLVDGDGSCGRRDEHDLRGWLTIVLFAVILTALAVAARAATWRRCTRAGGCS